MADCDSHSVTKGKQECASEAAHVDHPDRIGRYRIDEVLAQGSFGVDYLAHDEQLDRPVALKLIHAESMLNAADVEAYLAAARSVARLDHPHIVPVFDVGSTSEHACFVVSKYTESRTLSMTVRQSPLNHFQAAELAATIAETLHYAHELGVIHRDVTPRSICRATRR